MKEANMKEKCPNCIKPDKNITPMKNGKCGACGGKGYIIWENTGITLDKKCPHNGKCLEEGCDCNYCKFYRLV